MSHAPTASGRAKPKPRLSLFRLGRRSKATPPPAAVEYHSGDEYDMPPLPLASPTETKVEVEVEAEAEAEARCYTLPPRTTHMRQRSHFSIPDVLVTTCEEEGHETVVELKVPAHHRRLPQRKPSPTPTPTPHTPLIRLEQQPLPPSTPVTTPPPPPKRTRKSSFLGLAVGVRKNPDERKAREKEELKLIRQLERLDRMVREYDRKVQLEQQQQQQQHQQTTPVTRVQRALALSHAQADRAPRRRGSHKRRTQTRREDYRISMTASSS